MAAKRMFWVAALQSCTQNLSWTARLNDRKSPHTTIAQGAPIFPKGSAFRSWLSRSSLVTTTNFHGFKFMALGAAWLPPGAKLFDLR
jgi:hypothetical protein